MYCTTRDVERITGYTVTNEVILKAQAIVEAFTGRGESDVDGVRDIGILRRATAFQAAYMKDNNDMIYEQIAAATIGQNDSITTFKSGDTTSPWLAPLAVLACKHLSWNKSKSVHTGPIRQRLAYVPWERD